MSGGQALPVPAPLFRLVGAAVRLVGRVGPVRRRPPLGPVREQISLVVREVRAEADEVVSLRLERSPRDLDPAGPPDPGEEPGAPGDPEGSMLPAWRPGDHIDLVLPSGRVRQYSLCGDPADRRGYRIAVRRIADGGGGSVEVHRLAEGDQVGIRGPRAAFPLIRAPRYLFLAGGIGITPILPMVRAVAATRADWRFVYLGRDRASMPFLDEVAALDPGRVVIRADAEHAGPATGAELLAHAPGPAATGYLCGPPPMLDAVRAAVAGNAAALEALHHERFAAPPVLGGRPFTVELVRSGERLRIPADRSLLDVLRDGRPGVAYSCRQGFCGTCRVGVLDGTVAHRDRVLNPEERARAMTVCVSRAEGDRLVLDL